MPLQEIAIALSVGAGGLLAGALYVVVGGLGVARTLRRRIEALEGETAAISERLTRDQKRRAGQARQDVASMADLQREAAQRLAEVPQRPSARGFGAAGRR